MGSILPLSRRIAERPRGLVRPASDRRRHRRVPVEIDGRMLNELERESLCRTLNVSAGGAVLRASPRPSIGCGAVLYLGHFGRIPAHVVRHEDEDLFGVCFQAGAAKRERIVETLTWLLAGGAVEDIRRHPRREGGGDVSVRLDNGRELRCEIEDFSLVGMAVRHAGTKPLIGEWVRVSDLYGRVARYTEFGFAIDFEARRD